MTPRDNKNRPAPSARPVARLVHDVGKYISRTARNLTGAKMNPTLLGLFLSDLFATDGQERASVVFERGVRALDRTVADSDAVVRCREMLMEIDALEKEIRAGEALAIARAMALALEVDTLLRGLLNDVAKGGS